MKHKKFTYQGYYDKNKWSKGAPRQVKRNYEKSFRKHLQEELKKDLKDYEKAKERLEI